ncbi:MAG: SNF2-related protein [Thermoplasmatota archaeon]
MSADLVEKLYESWCPTGDVRDAANHLRNSGHVDHLVIGEKGARGRVRGRRNESSGFNVRVQFIDPISYECRCGKARNRACEHIGAFLLAIASRIREEEQTGGQAKVIAKSKEDYSLEVFKFLHDLFPGIGPKRAKAVARVFRTIPDLLGATPAQLRKLPDIGVGMADLLAGQLERYQRLGGATPPPPTSETAAPRVVVTAENVDWLRDLSLASEPGEGAVKISGPLPLSGRVVQTQMTSTLCFFRPKDPHDTLLRRAIRDIRRRTKGALRISRRHHLFVSDKPHWPAAIGQLEAKGARREIIHLVNLPLAGLTLIYDDKGRKARVMTDPPGVEEAYPEALRILEGTEGHEIEHTGQHLVNKESFPFARETLTDLGALLLRKRLRPVREITEWKAEDPADVAPGVPLLRPQLDLGPYMREELPPLLRPTVKLRAYQREGVAFIRASDYLCYLGDPPGLGKCVVGSSRLHTIEGPVRMDALWEQPLRSLGHDEDGGEWARLEKPVVVNAFDPARRAMAPTKVTKIYRQYVHEKLLRVRLADGSSLTCTKRHSWLRSEGGWTAAAGLARGDRVAVPSATSHRGSSRVDPKAAELMAWQLAEGNEHRNNPSQTPVWLFTHADDQIIARVRELAKAIGVELPAPRVSRQRVKVISTSRLRHVLVPLGYEACHLSADKIVPKTILNASLEAQRAFLRAFFEAEGCVNPTHIELSTASEDVANGLRAMLRNFGIWARTHEVWKAATNGSGDFRLYFRITIGGFDIPRFADEVGFLSSRKQSALEVLASKPRPSNVEGIPIGPILRTAREGHGIALDRLHHMTVEHIRGKGVLHERALKVASRMRDAGQPALAREIENLSNPALHWAEITSIEEVPFQGFVYDVEVPRLHNYVVNEIVTHNTIQAIAASLYLEGRVLVVCPAGARNVWKNEIQQHSNSTAFIFRPPMKDKPKREKFLVASYDAVLGHLEDIPLDEVELVILDEAHYVKNKDALRTQAVHSALRKIPKRVLLSGTPVMNRTEEVRKQLEFIHPDEWSNEIWFRNRFVAPLQWGTREVRLAALRRLREYFGGIMLRRRKEDVLNELPPKHTLVQWIDLPEPWKGQYEDEASMLREHILTHRETAFGEDYETTRGRVMRLKHLASQGKASSAEAKTREILAQPGEKVVIFAYYLEHLDALEKALKEFNPVVIHGGVVDKERDRAVRAFQEDPTVRVFLGQLTAAGTAITLTAARHAVFVDLDWNPANHQQASDRIHRIGQTREVFVHQLVAEQTIEETIVDILQKKSTMTAALLDADEDSPGVLPINRENQLVARLALEVAMGRPKSRAELEKEMPEEDDFSDLEPMKT